MIEILFQGGRTERRVVDAAEFDAILAEGEFAHRALQALPREELLRAFSAAYRRMAHRGHPLYEPLRAQGLAFFLSFIHSQSLGKLLDQGLASGGVPRARGTVGHWLAGNVPILGMISAVLSILTRNRSVLKVPSQAMDTVTPFLETFLDPEMGEAAEAGRAIAKACVVVRFGREEAAAHLALADHADVRMVWGAREAVASVRSLASTRRPEAETIAFGPKLSACVVDPAIVTDSDLDLVARDGALFFQLACTSPHAVFVLGGPEDAAAVARRLDEAFARQVERGFLPACDQFQGSRVLEYRARIGLSGGLVLPGRGTGWTVAVDRAAKEFPNWGFRFLTVIPVPDLDAIAALLPENVQSLACVLTDSVISGIVDHPGFSRVCRLTTPGHMHDFVLPWDGVQVLERLVRRLSVEIPRASA